MNEQPKYRNWLQLTKESPFAFLLAAFLRLCEGGSYLYLS
jgi:hypothetical protein